VTVKKRTDEEFVEMVRKEIARARAESPGPIATHAALVEAVGKVSEALMYSTWYAVVTEAVQVAVLAQRLAIEGDSTFETWRTGFRGDTEPRGVPLPTTPETAGKERVK
jgi:hypothetical protein